MRRHVLPILLLISVSFSLYANTLKNGFVYDDEYTIVNNPLIKDIRNIPKLFSKEHYFALSGEQTYRPVVTLTYFVDYALYGLKSWGFHLTNIFLHATNGILLYIFLTLIIRQSGVYPHLSALNRLFSNQPFVISLLFITHPVLTEAVNAASFREDLLVFLFYMATLNLYVYLRSNLIRPALSFLLYVVSCLIFLLALLSKEMALTLPFAIFVYEWVYSNKRRLFLAYIVGYVLIVLIYISISYYFHFSQSMGSLSPWSLPSRLQTIPWLIISYIKLYLYPVNLSADYTIMPVTLPLFIISFLIIGTFIVIALILKKLEKGIIFGITVFMLTLIPILNVARLINPFAERYFYLPSIGLAISLGLAINLIYRLLTKTQAIPNHNIYIFLLFSIIAFYSISTIKRNTVWKDNDSLWSDTIKKMPASSRAHYNLGLVYDARGETAAAIKEYTAALKLKPNEADFHTAVGLAYYRSAEFDKAIQEFEISLRQGGRASELYNNLGLVYYMQGNLDLALKEMLSALSLNESSPDIYNNLGLIYFKRRQLDLAIKAFGTAIRLKPDFADAYYNTGLVYSAKGNLEMAVMEYKKAISLKPDEVDYHICLGLIYYERKQFEEAISEYQVVLKLRPNDVETHYNLGNAYLEKGQLDMAKTEFETTFRLNPNFEAGREALEKIKY